jgi:peptidyl-prolyl cis-trans isomerase SurA
MPEFGVATYDGGFEKAAFSLKNDSDISEPFQTEFGYHIIERISRTPIPENKNNEAYMANLKQEVLSDKRIALAKEKFLKEVLEKTGYKKNNKIKEKDIWKINDNFAKTKKKIALGDVNENIVLFSFNNAKVKVGDWMQYVRSVKTTYAAHAEQTHDELYKNYVSVATFENYKNRLENFNPEFKYQLQEFKDGNMLFEIMERKVWSKASADSVGLEQYYNEHKTNYKWNVSADAVLFSCANTTEAKIAIEEINKGKNWKELVKDNLQIEADSGRYELSQIPVKDKTNFITGLITEPVVNSGDGTAIFSLVIKTYPEDQQRSFADARGLVINDYQNFLEKKWIETLKKKYPIIVNEKVFQSISE